MEICSYPAEASQTAKGSHQIICMDMEEDMKTPKIKERNSCSVSDMLYLMGGSSSTSSLSLSSTTDLSSNQSTISSSSSCKSSFKSRSSSFSKPSWLLSTVADLDEKMKIVAMNNKSSRGTEKEENCNKTENDSFAQRAEAYYRTRPQLLSLLNDLYNGYVSLADRYSQTLAKHNRSPISAIHFNNIDGYDCDDQVESDISINDEHVANSDVESSISYQGQASLNEFVCADLIVAELVIKMVDFDIVVNELSVVEKRWNDSSKKIELQRSLLEVLESERVILLNENSRLGYKVAVLGEENKGLMCENIFMKKKAGELARCIRKTREDHRVCMLFQKIEDLQGQIYTLEKRNKDYYQQIIERDALLMQFQKQAKEDGKIANGVPTLGDRFRVDEETEYGKVILKSSPKKVNARDSDSDGGKPGNTLSKLWERVKNLDLLQCGPHFKN